MAAIRSSRPAVWVFITYVIGYGRDNGSSGQDSDVIAVLDSFLEHVKSLKQEERLTFVNGQEIVGAVRREQ
jgi:hypothetical protein